MGAQHGKSAPKFENIDATSAERLAILFNNYGEEKEKMNQKQFEAAFPVLTPISTILYPKIAAKEADGKIHLATLIKYCDAAFGTYSDLATVLSELISDDVTMVIEKVCQIYCGANRFNETNHRKLIEYLNHQKSSSFEQFFLECPLFVKLSKFIFTSILSTMPEVGLRPHLVGGVSQILGPADCIVLNSHLAMDQQKKWTLLFSTSTMGASFSQMVKRINHEGPCLVVIRSESQHVFGFYASEGISSGPLYHGGHQCFIFELEPNIRLYSATGRESSYVYLNFQQQRLPNGLGIGGKEDVWPIFIDEEFGTGKCQKDSAAFEKCFVANETNFKIQNLEVWRVGEKPVQRDEDGEIIVPKAEKSIIDKDPEAQAVLEMAGRSMHSEAYRDPAPLLDDEDQYK